VHGEAGHRISLSRKHLEGTSCLFHGFRAIPLTQVVFAHRHRRTHSNEPNGDDTERNDTLPSQVNVLENRLLRERRVLVFGTIDDKLARDVCARLLSLASESSDPIDVFINSPGGHVESGNPYREIHTRGAESLIARAATR